MYCQTFWVIIANVFYLLASYICYQQITNKISANRRFFLIFLVIVALLIHSAHLYQQVFSSARPAISLSISLSMAGWITVLLYLVTSVIRKTLELGVIVLPIGLLSLWLGNEWIASTTTSSVISEQWPHILIAIPTYGTLFLVFSQAIFLVFQDYRLNNPKENHPFLSFPALQTMESNLFGFNLLGFILLTLSLVIGIASNLIESGKIMDITHHTLFSIMAWLGFGVVVIGRAKYGWRGRGAALWIIVAFVILMFAYFGTRIVRDLIL